MHSFKDSEGRVWAVAVNVAQLNRVEAAHQTDLLSLLDGAAEGLVELVNRPARLVAVLYVLCKAQAEAKGVGEEGFGEAMAGDVLGDAAEAFVQALVDFFPDPQRRAALRRAWELSKGAAGEVNRRTAEGLAKTTVEDVLNRLGGPSGAAPESSASTPPRSPSAS